MFIRTNRLRIAQVIIYCLLLLAEIPATRIMSSSSNNHHRRRHQQQHNNSIGRLRDEKDEIENDCDSGQYNNNNMDKIKCLNVPMKPRQIATPSVDPRKVKKVNENVKTKNSPLIKGLVVLKIQNYSPSDEKKNNHRQSDFFPTPLSPYQMLGAFNEYGKLTAKKFNTYEATHMEALTELANIVEHLERGDFLMKSMVESDLEDDKAMNSPAAVSEAVKELTDSLVGLQGHIRDGELYDEYRKRLLRLLDNDNTETAPIVGIVGETHSDNENQRKGNDLAHVESKSLHIRKPNQMMIYKKPKSFQSRKDPSIYLPNSRQMLKKPHDNDKVSCYLSPPEVLETVDIDPYAGIDPHHIKDAVESFEHIPFDQLYKEYREQLEHLNKILLAKQDWWRDARSEGDKVRSGRNIAKSMASAGNSAFPDILAPQFNVPSDPTAVIQGGLLRNMADEMNISPVELARRITTTVNAPNPSQQQQPHHQLDVASQAIATKIPIVNIGGGETWQSVGAPVVPAATATGPQVAPASPSVPASASAPTSASASVPASVPASTGASLPASSAATAPTGASSPVTNTAMNLSPVLDKILQQLQLIQDAKEADKAGEDSDKKNKDLPCCFEDPVAGAPCDLSGSWESQILGIRINIQIPIDMRMKLKEKENEKPTCYQPPRKISERLQRECVKINQLKSGNRGDKMQMSEGGLVNVTIVDTVPKKSGGMFEDIKEWSFSGRILSTLGGPLAITCRKNNNVIGHFLGYCRTCGCVDTIFGSWTFMMPSRDCQDIYASIFDRRDLLRRYTLEERRRDRIKDRLYQKSKFGKEEAAKKEKEKEKNMV